MLSQKVTSVFNPGFSFENESDALNSHFKLVKPAKPSPIDEEADLGDVIDNAEGDDIDNELESDNESKKELEKLIKKKDHVRLKSQQSKVKQVVADDFFELQSDKQLEENLKTSNFEDMNLSKPLIKALANMGMANPTKIQTAAIPTALMGKDICACAVTGSGKTLAFMLPTLERLLYKPKHSQVTRVLVLTPTRELAVQICKVTRDLSQFTNINTCLCVGNDIRLFTLDSEKQSKRIFVFFLRWL